MKRNNTYAGVWLLLTVVLAVVMLISFSDDLTLGSYTVKKAPFKEHLLNTPHTERLSGQELADSLEEQRRKMEISVDTLPQSILLIGDSMTYNLALQLAKYAKSSGHVFHAVNWDSSNTKIWAQSDTLEYFMNQFHPTVIFISLGANELYLTNPEGHRKYVEAILSKIGDTPYVWIGPPNWKEDAGLNDMIRSACKPGSFFLSAGMTFQRKKDGVHPTRESSALWVDSIVRWLPNSSHPFVVTNPSDSIGKVNPDIVLLKPKR